MASKAYPGATAGRNGEAIKVSDTRSSERNRNDIERRAYQLYLQREKKEGGAQEDWIQAEKEVKEDVARSKGLEAVSHDHTSLHR